MNPLFGVIGPGFLNQVPTSVNQNCLVLSREWGMDYGDYYWGLYRDYYRDPFPHSLLSTRQ